MWRQSELWIIYCHVKISDTEEYPQIIPVPCGKHPQQTLRWVATNAIARTDSVNLQGWKQLGLPRRVSLESFEGKKLPIGLNAGPFTEVLENGDHIYIIPERFRAP